MNSSVYSNDIQLSRYERLKNLSKSYAIYEIFYSNERSFDFVEELKNEFNYLLVLNSENIVKDYYLAGQKRI
jgi:hypothetical protein